MSEVQRLFSEGATDAVGFMAGALLGYGIGYVMGLDLFAPGYDSASIFAIALVGLGGAAALVLMRRSEAQKRGLAPLAVIRGHAAFADEPGLFPTAPVGAIKRLMSQTGWNLNDVDLFEINEAFAVVTLVTMSELDLPHDKVNIHGGACALGHPIGASGARILVTLLSALRQKKLKQGVAAICIGGGEATAIAVECLY